jgi:hypothetical protein
MAIASMVLGIISLPLMFGYCMGAPCAILAIIFGHTARARARRGLGGGEGMALAGLICGYVGLLLVGTVVLIIFIVIAYAANAAH